MSDHPGTIIVSPAAESLTADVEFFIGDGEVYLAVIKAHGSWNREQVAAISKWMSPAPAEDGDPHRTETTSSDATSQP